jgi:hypothetical protein
VAGKNKISLKEFQRITALNESKNFGEMGVVTDEGVEHFDLGDNGEQAEGIISALQADFLLLSLLQRLNDRQKVILLYQVLREAGYNLNHEDCARTLSLSRKQYMFYVRKVKERSYKIIHQP